MRWNQYGMRPKTKNLFTLLQARASRLRLPATHCQLTITHHPPPTAHCPLRVPKAKSLFTLLQIVSIVPTMYEVSLPSELTKWAEALRWPEFIGFNLFIPGGCYGSLIHTTIHASIQTSFAPFHTAILYLGFSLFIRGGCCGAPAFSPAFTPTHPHTHYIHSRRSRVPESPPLCHHVDAGSLLLTKPLPIIHNLNTGMFAGCTFTALTPPSTCMLLPGPAPLRHTSTSRPRRPPALGGGTHILAHRCSPFTSSHLCSPSNTRYSALPEPAPLRHSFVWPIAPVALPLLGGATLPFSHTYSSRHATMFLVCTSSPPFSTHTPQAPT